MQAVHKTAGGRSDDVGHRRGKVYEEQGFRNEGVQTSSQNFLANP
jgi:hypothetical protein